MGQHKHNPVAIAKAKGEPLPDKRRKIGKREMECLIRARLVNELRDKTGLPSDFVNGPYSTLF